MHSIKVCQVYLGFSLGYNWSLKNSTMVISMDRKEYTYCTWFMRDFSSKLPTARETTSVDVKCFSTNLWPAVVTCSKISYFHTNVSRMKKFDLSRCFLPAYNLFIYDEPLTRTIYLILVGTNKSYPFPEFYIWVSERKEKMSIFRAELPFLNAQFAPIDQSGVSLRFLCGLHWKYRSKSFATYRPTNAFWGPLP